ncbi:ATP-dependent helicase [Phormidium sp. CCY1219]|uniref:ATP-dependent helicase n=1 Tax=Phormidium sp. CCY1219 TaxID=2886104 RepID=UPI002D1F60AD|nr:ATP-dependent helicase [Phormidium sp. CCY1219]MEB3830503.1 ATP-dependent helicase [Phormidium sp. CCY1219]
MPNDFDGTVNPSVAQAPTPVEETRREAWQRIRNRLRPGQQQMADWQTGPLAVSAVPGAGKSKGMADAAALAIARNALHYRRQLIVVTFTRSAAANLKLKIRQTLRELQLPQVGFSVNTLHGLALNIATRHPDLSGLNFEELTLITPNQSHRTIALSVERWIAANPRRFQRLIEGRQFDGEEAERLRRQSVLRTEVLPQLAHTVIREAKSSGLLPEDLGDLAREFENRVYDDEYEIVAIAAGLYGQYESLLRSRQFIDYDDMILAALRVLENDTARGLWQQQVFAVFEDEAQDSSPLQTQLLEILATDRDRPDAPPNLIRVGDPNQAINSTFTPADPIYFRRFCERCDRHHLLATMDRAGRSTQIIINAANFALGWINRYYTQRHTSQQEEGSTPSLPFRLQTIRPVEPGDPQPGANPPHVGGGLEIYRPRDIYHTVELLGKRVCELFSENREGRSAAVLVRENRQARFIQEVLSNPRLYGIECNLASQGIPVFDVAQSDRRSHVPAEILALLSFIDRPHSPDYLKAALRVFVDRKLIPAQDLNALSSLPEQFLYPGPLDPPQPPAVLQARRLCCSLLKSRMELPLYQLISFLALALQYNQAELATADKLSDRLVQQTAGNRSLQTMLTVLSEIVSSERFEPVDTEEDAESIYTRPGQLTLITMHKAKGLDWDYVFIPFLHENVIPGTLWVPPPAQFLGEYTLAEVARALIRANLHQKSDRDAFANHPVTYPSIATAWQQAEALKIAEEYRLLYVAMTRAKRLLWMSAAQKAPFTWSKPENQDPRKPCPVLPALIDAFPDTFVPLSAALD